nr:type II secretion system F family protein [uncultured Acetobacter sp.]
MSATWRYTALTSDGQLKRGHAQGADEKHVIADLRRSGLTPVRVRQQSERGGLGWLQVSFSLRRAGVSRAQVTDITRELALMLGAGLDLDRGLRFLIETLPEKGGAGRRSRAVLIQLREAMRNGGSFASALATRADCFSPLYINLVKAGEAGGALGDSLDRLATLMERERKLTTSIQSALIYPAILVVASIGSVVLLLTGVLPQFVPLFAEAGAQLPLVTRIVIAAGDFLKNWGLAMLLMFIGGAFCLRALLARPAFRLGFDQVLLRLPVAGSLSQDVMAARLTRTLGTLLQNGVSLLSALKISEDVIGNRAGAQAVAEAALIAREGGGLSRPLEAAGVFPPRAIHLMRLGEETAQLGPLCLRAAELHEEAVRIGLQRLVALLVPAITVVMGAVVAGIVSALLLAMLGLNDLAH